MAGGSGLSSPKARKTLIRGQNELQRARGSLEWDPVGTWGGAGATGTATEPCRCCGSSVSHFLHPGGSLLLLFGKEIPGGVAIQPGRGGCSRPIPPRSPENKSQKFHKRAREGEQMVETSMITSPCRLSFPHSKNGKLNALLLCYSMCC